MCTFSLIKIIEKSFKFLSFFQESERQEKIQAPSTGSHAVTALIPPGLLVSQDHEHVYLVGIGQPDNQTGGLP